MKLKFKLAAGVVSTLMFVGTAAAAVSYTPGTYEGEAIGRNGPVKVQVTVAKDRIESIRVVSHNESVGLSDAPINTLPKTIVDKQSLAGDTGTYNQHINRFILRRLNSSGHCRSNQ